MAKRNADKSFQRPPSKRQSSRPTSVLQPSPAQFRKLFEHDNLCAQQYMRIPLRMCTSQESHDLPGVAALSELQMAALLNEIDDIWRKCSVIFEAFTDPKEAHLGWRLRVAKNLPMKLNIKENDRLVVGWKAVCPQTGPSSHLYDRSLMLNLNQYLGGPISYCNWSMQETVSVRQAEHGPWSHLVRAEVKNQAAGTELLWNYGNKCRENTFDESDWFKPECCSISTTTVKPIRLLQREIFLERCVLCGLTYRSMHRDATKRNAQKKVHFVQFHSNYLGSDWNGHGSFDPKEYNVDLDCARLEAERLNRLLTRLKKSNWSVMPACRVLQNGDLSGTKEEVLHRFKQACEQLKACGVVVLRGRTTATSFEDLTPVSCMTFTRVFPPEVKKTYAMLPQQLIDHKEELENWAIQDAMMVLNLDPNPSTVIDESDSVPFN